MFKMYEKIRFEWFIVKEVFKTIWRMCKHARSIMPVLSILNPNAVFKIDEDGPWIRGNYYKYIKHIYAV